MKRIIPLIIAMLLALPAAGCSGTKEPPKPAATDGETPNHVTAFGAVRCAESPVLRLPVETAILEVYAREGQMLPPHTPVLRIDTALLRGEIERIGHETAALTAAMAGYGAQLKQAEADLAAAQSAVKQFNAEKLLRVLDRFANASGKKRDAAEHELLECLKAIGSVGRYHDLAALSADRRNVRDNARPVLLELQARLEEDRRAREAAVNALRRALEEAEAEILPVREKAAALENILGGGVLCGVGSFDAQGVLTTGGRPLMPAAALPQPGQTLAPGEAVAGFDALDTLEVLVNVEEQLIGGIAVGAEAQLSPLYDKGTVWLGTVAAVSGRAVTVNGETVVPVTVKSGDMALGPGYNVTVKIYPAR